MKDYIGFLLVFIFSVQSAFAALPPTTVSGQNEATKTTTFNLLTPNFTSTTTGGATRLLETDLNNLLKNPSFEATTFSTSWTVAGTATAAVCTTSLCQLNGKQAANISASGTSAGRLLTQAVDITNRPTASFTTGVNMEATLWINTPKTDVQVCLTDTSTDVLCQAVTGDSTWRQYTVNAAMPASGNIGVTVKQTGTVSGQLYVDWGYVGVARNVGLSLNPFSYSAKVSSAGVVSDENSDFINGNASIANTSEFTVTFNSSLFTAAPNCTATGVETTTAAPIVKVFTQATTSSVVIKTYSNLAAATAYGFVLNCMASSNTLQNIVRYDQSNTNFQAWAITSPNSSWTGVTPAASRCNYKRDGKFMEFICLVNLSGGAASIAQLSLPSGLHTSTLYTNLATQCQPVGFMSIDAAITMYHVCAQTNVTYVNIAVSSDPGDPANASSVGNGDFSLTGRVAIEEWSDSLNAPLLVGSVVSPTSGQMQIVAADVSCNAASSITTQSGGVSSIGNRATAACILTLTAGTFSATPWACQVTTKATTVQATACSCASSTSCTVYGASADYTAYVTIMGAR